MKLACFILKWSESKWEAISLLISRIYYMERLWLWRFGKCQVTDVMITPDQACWWPNHKCQWNWIRKEKMTNRPLNWSRRNHSKEVKHNIYVRAAVCCFRKQIVNSNKKKELNISLCLPIGTPSLSPFQAILFTFRVRRWIHSWEWVDCPRAVCIFP